MKLLFICNQNKNRSKTAEHLFKDKFETRSAGLYNRKPITAKELSWADIVFVMEDEQRSELAKRFPKQYLQKMIISLDIPDVYTYDNDKLKKILATKFNQHKSILT